MDDRMTSSARITDSGRKGDLRIGFGYERQNHGGPEPVMYVYAARAPNLVVSVPLSLMYLFDTRDRLPSGQLAAMEHAQRVANAVYGRIASQMETHRVLDAITDWITDLKNMPPPSTLRNPEMLERVLQAKGYDLVR